MGVGTILSEHKPANTGMARKSLINCLFWTVRSTFYHRAPCMLLSARTSSGDGTWSGGTGLLCACSLLWSIRRYLGWVGQPGEIKKPYGKEFDWEGSCRGQLEWKPCTMFNYVSKLLVETEGLSFSSHGVVSDCQIEKGSYITKKIKSLMLVKALIEINVILCNMSLLNKSEFLVEKTWICVWM